MKRTKRVFLPVIIAAIACLFPVCAGQGSGRTDGAAVYSRVQASTVGTAATPVYGETAAGVSVEKITEVIDQMAELERSGIFFQGMGLRESALRDSAGDHAGAAAALYKELAWAYGRGLLEKESLTESLERLRENAVKQGKQAAAWAVQAIFAFEQGRWNDAGEQLAELFGEIDEPDNYVNLMLLSCALEKNPGDRKAVSAYRSIRARYSQFPEFWYRGARLFSGNIAAEYAEYCLNLSSGGPYAAECRSILSVNLGLRTEDGASIKSKKEIDEIVSGAVSQGNPQALESLMPLISLPENPITVYAMEGLKPLAALPKFQEFFSAKAAAAKGRLAERLNYICRG